MLHTIAQISDIHIAPPGENPCGIDVRKNFLKILDRLRQSNAEYIIVTGDLCESDGEREIYRWVKNQLDELSIPYTVIPGNHDDTKMLTEIFTEGFTEGFTEASSTTKHTLDGAVCYSTDLFGIETYFLDTSQDTLPVSSIRWLQRQLSHNGGDVLLCMHHPPAICGVPFMDRKYPLANIDEFQDVLLATQKNISVLCGHYHVDKVVKIRNLTIFICPSTFFQIDQDEEDLKRDFSSIGWRELEIESNTLRILTRTIPTDGPTITTHQNEEKNE